MQYPIGSRTDSSHPAGLAALYPAWSKRAAAAAPDPFRFIATLAGRDDAPSGREHLLDFMQSIGLARNLRNFGLSADDCPALARAVSGNLNNDPGDTSLRTLEEIYRESV
jgi:alcohol dehydrogenase class IV